MLQPETIFVNANLITLDGRQPRAEAMAISGERIALVGDNLAVTSAAGPQTRRMDLDGRTVVPGFCDSHIHLASFGTNLLRQADLTGSATIDALLGRLSDLAGRTSGWIQGRGFDQSKLAERRFPNRTELDRVSRNRPIVISRVCGHAGVLNSGAIELLNPAQRARGDAESGLFTEEALWAIYSHVPGLNEEEMEQAVLAACDVLLKTGITSVQTLLDTPEQMTAYTRLHRRGRLPVRVVAMPQWSEVETLHRYGIRTGFGDERLMFGAAKLFSDGSLGAQTALLADPYADKPETRGLRTYDPDDLKQRVLAAQNLGFQVAIHAIGDQAVRETIAAIEDALDHDPQHLDNHYHRHRIEHVSLCPPDCLARLAQRKIIATLQPQFVTSDTWTPDRIGPQRARWAYPFRSLIEAGVPVSLSSDSPVEWPSAFECLASAMGRHAWSPDQALTSMQAIHAYCLGSAYAGHVEHQQGSLEAGKLADFVMLSADPSTLAAPEIRSLSAEQVWVGGTRVR